jgi:hypothetical protein
MAQLMTRPEFRDAIRRDLQIVPPIDTGVPGTVPGQQPTNAPNPTNAQINQCIQQAISDINRFSGFHVNQITTTVPAVDSSTLGPYGTSMLSLGTMSGSVNDIRRVLWTPSDPTGVPQLLFPVNRNALDRGEVSTYYNVAPGMPQMWYIEGYALYITPAPSMAGTLTLTAGTGVLGLQGETDTLDQCPADLQYVVEYQAVVRLSKLSTMDIEAKERAQMFGEDAAIGMRQFAAWIEGQSGVVQPTLGFQSYRGGYGTRRVVR